MSTIPVQVAGFPVTSPSSRVAEGRRRLAVRLLADGGHDLRNIPRYLARHALLVLALLGVMSLWDARGDGTIPMTLPLRGPIDPRCNSSRHCAAPDVSDSARWLGMSPSLAILDEVNPAVAGWVRQRHEQGDLVFSERCPMRRGAWSSLARYDHLSRKLTVYRTIFEEDDGTVAAILCHEFRHSRQNSAKVLRQVLAKVFDSQGDMSAIENDAELYEHQARVAVFGHD